MDDDIFTNAPKVNPTLKPKRMLEKDVEKSFKRMIETLGGKAYKFKSPSYPSVPDRICVMGPAHRSIIFFCELKRPGESPTADQWREIGELRARGATVFVVDHVGAEPEGKHDSVGYVRRWLENAVQRA